MHSLTIHVILDYFTQVLIPVIKGNFLCCTSRLQLGCLHRAKPASLRDEGEVQRANLTGTATLADLHKATVGEAGNP